jgi:hypothetical protein
MKTSQLILAAVLAATAVSATAGRVVRAPDGTWSCIDHDEYCKDFNNSKSFRESESKRHEDGYQARLKMEKDEKEAKARIEKRQREYEQGWVVLGTAQSNDSRKPNGTVLVNKATIKNDSLVGLQAEWMTSYPNMGSIKYVVGFDCVGLTFTPLLQTSYREELGKGEGTITYTANLRQLQRTDIPRDSVVELVRKFACEQQVARPAIQPAPAAVPKAGDATSNAAASQSSTAQTWQPSFDCAKASTGAERLICSDRLLSEADVKMAALYRTALSAAADKKTLQREQGSWRANVRDACADAQCMLKAYQGRISQFSN